MKIRSTEQIKQGLDREHDVTPGLSRSCFYQAFSSPVTRPPSCLEQVSGCQQAGDTQWGSILAGQVPPLLPGECLHAPPSLCSPRTSQPSRPQQHPTLGTSGDTGSPSTQPAIATCCHGQGWALRSMRPRLVLSIFTLACGCLELRKSREGFEDSCPSKSI